MTAVRREACRNPSPDALVPAPATRFLVDHGELARRGDVPWDTGGSCGRIGLDEKARTVVHSGTFPCQRTARFAAPHGPWRSARGRCRLSVQLGRSGRGHGFFPPSVSQQFRPPPWRLCKEAKEQPSRGPHGWAMLDIPPKWLILGSAGYQASLQTTDSPTGRVSFTTCEMLMMMSLFHRTLIDMHAVQGSRDVECGIE